MVVLLTSGIVVSTSAESQSDNTDTQEYGQDVENSTGQNNTETMESVIDTAGIQRQLDAESAALMNLDGVSVASDQDVTQSILDLYPQYKNYNGEMEGVSVDKSWTGDAEYNRPDSVTFDLYLDGNVIDTLTLTAADDWKGSFSNHYPAYKLNANGEYELDEKGEKIPLDYQVVEREVENYKPAYSQKRHQTTIDSSRIHLFVPATELKAGEKYIVLNSNQIGQQKLYRAEAYQTDHMLSTSMTVSDKTVKDKDGNAYSNYVIMNDGDGSYDGLLWTAYNAGENKYYMFSDVYEIWKECHGLIDMKSTQNKLSCPHVSELGKGTNSSTQGFFKVAGDPVGNAYKTSSSTENLYFYKEVILPDGAFNSWQTEAFVSNRYDPPITVDPSEPAASEKTDLSVSKTWNDGDASDRPDQITVHLYADGVDTGKTVTLDKEHNWTTSFKDLDVYKDGKKISYSVVEDVPDGYSASYKYDDMNSSGSGGNKGYWVRTDKLVDGETYLIVTSPDAGSVVGMEIKEDGSGFKWTKGNAGTISVEKGPITINGQNYTTYITEEEAAQHTRMQWKAKYHSESDGGQAGYHKWFLLESVSNPGCYPKFNGEGDISDGTAHESLLYYGLQWTEGEGQNGYQALDEKGDTQITPKVNNYPNDFSYVFGNHDHYFLLSNNHTGDANAVTAQTFYLYKFVKSTGPAVTITNTKSDKTSLTVYKNWRDDNNKYGKRPDAIRVKLLENGEETGQYAELNEANNWTYTFIDLPKVDKKGNEIQYSAKETDLPEGYTSSVTTGTSGGTEERIEYSYAWVPVTTMKAGGTYILTSDIQGSPSTIGVSSDGKSTLSGTTVTIKSDETLTGEDGNKYNSYITDEVAQKVTQWTAEASGNYVILKNGKGYLQKGKGDLEDASNATKLQYDDKNHALKSDDKKNPYMSSDGNFNKNKPEVKTYIFERVKIINTVTTDTTQNVTTITNTYKETTEFTLQKLDGNTGKKLSGKYKFTLKDATGAIVGDNKDVQVDKDGKIRFNDLAYGDYILEETEAEEYYTKLPETIQLSISKKGIVLKNAEALKSWVTVEKESEGIYFLNVKNYKLVNMPVTGVSRPIQLVLLGLSLLIGGTLLMINSKRRSDQGGKSQDNS